MFGRLGPGRFRVGGGAPAAASSLSTAAAPTDPSVCFGGRRADRALTRRPGGEALVHVLAGWGSAVVSEALLALETRLSGTGAEPYSANTTPACWGKAVTPAEGLVC